MKLKPFRAAPAPLRLLSALALLAFSSCSVFAAGSVVTVDKNAAGQYSLIYNGQPYYINGAGGHDRLEMLKKSGGNSIRIWGIDDMDKVVDGKPLMDRAQELGLTITAGIWIGHERHGFNYNDQKQIEKQREMVRAAVRKYKDAPALLVWGLGNEMEGEGEINPAIFKELEELAKIIKEEDKNHPVMTVLAGAGAKKVKAVIEFCPSIDILGVNVYSGGGGSGKAVKDAGWTKAFCLTEFGPQGQWEVEKTKWDAPIEPTGLKKVASYWATQDMLRENSKDTCVGSYVFLWGQKQEVTSTWYGMFLDTGEKLPTVDMMTYVWTGKWPENRSPKITELTTPLKESIVKAGSTVEATVAAEDKENDTLTYEWMVVAESTDRRAGGDKESVPPSLPECTAGQTGPKATIKVPTKPGAYRLFITVKDGKGGASKDNTPFKVE